MAGLNFPEIVAALDDAYAAIEGIAGEPGAEEARAILSRLGAAIRDRGVGADAATDPSCPFEPGRFLPPGVEELLAANEARKTRAGDHSRLEGREGSKPEDADSGSFRLTYGKHKGRTLTEVVRDHRDRSYLGWLADQRWCKGKMKRAVLAVLNG